MKKLVSLKTLMVLMISTVIILPMATLTILNYQDSVKDSYKKYGEEMTISANGIKHSVEARLIDADTTMKSLSQDPEILSGDGNRQRALLEKVTKMQPLFELLYVTNTTGMQTARSSGENANRSDREWFQKALQGEYYFSGSYISKATNQPTITIALPIKNQAGTIVGTIGGDLSLGNLQSLVKDIKIGKTGYAYLTDQKGITIAHPNFDEYVLKQKDIGTTFSVADALKGNKNVANWVNSKGVSEYGAYLPVFTPDGKSNWTVTMQIPQEELKQISEQVLIKDILVTLVLTLIASVLTYFISNIIVNPVKRVMEITSKVSHGDLTVSASGKTVAREFSQLYESINDMIGKLRDLLQVTHRNANLVSGASEKLTQAMISISDGATQVAATMEQLSAGNQNQSEQVDSAAFGMENLRSEVKMITERANQVHKLTKALDDESRRSMEGMNHATDQMVVMQEDSRKSADQIISLEHKSQQIEQTVTLITEIAKQTNLLALNAAIEAARAGEAGRGFAIVADEVRKLAEESGKAAEKITSIILDIRHETQLAVTLMTKGADDAQKGVQSVLETLNSIERITNSIDDVVNHTSDVAESTERMYRSMEEVSSVVSNLAAISEQTAAATQEVTASVSDQSSTTQQLAISAQELSLLSNELEETVKKFKLK